MRVLISGGGTAGHINPAIAIAKKIKKEVPDAVIAFVGTPDGMENALVKREGYEIFHVEVKGFRRKLTLENLDVLKKAIISPIKAKKIIKSFKPDIVIGTGGYVSWPVLKAASGMKIPTCIHEQNAIVGVTTKMLSKCVDKVMVSFAGTESQLKCDKSHTVLVGNPVNPRIFEVNKETEMEKLGKTDKPYLLSYGGSLGSKVMNNVIFDMIEKEDIGIYHTHGVGSYEYKRRKEEIESRGLDKKDGVELFEYIYDMPERMCASDLVVARAGAITLSELAILGKPAILIPSPNVTDNHQFKNAKVIENAGGAVVIEEKDLTYVTLSCKIRELIFDKEKLSSMSESMKKLAILDSENRIFDVIKNLVKIGE